MLKLIFYSTFIFSMAVQAVDLSCQNYAANTCKASNLNAFLARREWIDQHLKERSEIVNIEKEKYENYIRSIRGDKGYASDVSTKLDIHNIKTQFKIVKEINKRIVSLNERISLVRQSAAWRVKLQETLDVFKKMKINILANYPILMTESFVKLLKTNKNIKDEKLDRTVLSASTSMYQHLSNNWVFETRARYAVINNDYKSNELSTLLGQLNLQEEIYNHDYPRSLCNFFQEAIRKKEEHDQQKVITDGVIALSPILLPPFLKAGSYTGKLLKIANLGFRTQVFNSVNTLALSSSAYLLSGTAKDLDDKIRECKFLKSELYAKKTEQNHSEYTQCQEQYISHVKFLLVSGTFGAASSSHLYGEFLDSIKSIQNGFKLITTSNTDHFFTQLKHVPIMRDDFYDLGLKLTRKDDEIFVMNLSNVKPNSQTEGIATRYWDHVAGIYKQRLNLSDAEVESFIQSSKDMSYRTLLVVNRKRNPTPKDPEFNGGVALVSSRDELEPLPLEKALNIRLKKKGKASEIVRLTADTKSNQFNEIMSVLTQISRADDEIKEFYIYTSKLHYRLYKRVFKEHEVVIKNDRDFVIKLTREDMISATN